jgi:hypothetical protein
MAAVVAAVVHDERAFSGGVAASIVDNVGGGDVTGRHGPSVVAP